MEALASGRFKPAATASARGRLLLQATIFMCEASRLRYGGGLATGGGAVNQAESARERSVAAWIALRKISGRASSARNSLSASAVVPPGDVTLMRNCAASSS